MANIDRLAERYSQIIPVGTKFKVLYKHPTLSGPSADTVCQRARMALMGKQPQHVVIGTLKGDPEKSSRFWPVRIRAVFVTGQNRSTVIAVTDFEGFGIRHRALRSIDNKWVIFEDYNPHDRTCHNSFIECE